MVLPLLQNCMVNSLFTSPKLPDRLPSPPKPCGPLFPFIRTTWTSIYLLASEQRGSPLSPENLVVLLLWLPGLGFKSQCPFSFAAPFPTPPTVSYTCQHPRILPALLGCHCKSVQVCPHGMEPIISKLSHKPCNQGELLPSPILGGIRFHPPGSKHGHSYVTYL